MLLVSQMETLQRILIVDDDDDLRIVATLGLESAGSFAVKSCGTAEEALGLVRSFQPDLLLLDVQLPDRSGPDLLGELRRSPSAPPVVFLTARARPDDRQRYLELGALEVIPKPFEPMKLAEQVLAIWRRWRQPVG